MKLRLDSVVIQQGRLAEAQKTLGSDEMLTMIKHGAQQIFAGKDSTITDDDIDVILSQAEKKTKELNEELDKMGESKLRNFTTENPSLYDFEGENYKGKAVIHGFIEPPKRERKSNYNIDQMYKDQKAEPSSGKGHKPPKPKNLPNVFDFQFYSKRLYDLIENEIYYFRKMVGYNPVAPPELTGKDAEKFVKDEQRKIEKSFEVTDELLDERNELLNGEGTCKIISNMVLLFRL